MMLTWKKLIGAALAVFVLGMLVAWSGIINIGASTEHAAVTDWFLHWTMRNSARTQSAMMSVDRVADPSGIVSAAGHYAATCAVCHGAPGERPSPVMQATSPPAPDLAVTAVEWTDEELFWIIKHGVMFTPMPAWPTQVRDDEVARMVAFVRQLPGMSPARYRELAYGSAPRIVGGEALLAREALADCARCHGDDGLGRGRPEIPILAGQNAEYLYAALAAYAAGERPSGVMQTAAARVDDDVFGDLARHYSALPGGLSRAPLTLEAEDERALRIVLRGLPEANLPACSTCHAPTRRANYPVLTGQNEVYIAGRLRNWRGDPNIVDAHKSNAPMPVIARRIPEEMIEPLARYFARQRPDPIPATSPPRSP